MCLLQVSLGHFFFGGSQSLSKIDYPMKAILERSCVDIIIGALR